MQNPGQSLGQYTQNTEFRKALAVGAVSGAVSGVMGLLPAGSLLGAVGLGALRGAAVGGVGQVIANLFTPCTPWHQGIGRAMLAGAIGGAIAGGVGFGIRTGIEIKLGRNLRIAPFGNRTGNPSGELPHYHLRGKQLPSGATTDGQGIGRHRPWATSQHDTNILDRFFDTTVLPEFFQRILRR